MSDQPVVVEKSSGAGIIVGVVALVVMLLIAYFAWQYFGGQSPVNTTNVTVPAPNVNVQAPSTN